jgi:uncharacterized membrane protein YeaQ/YmgE (transglycosylase-associated protein family)
MFIIFWILIGGLVGLINGKVVKNRPLAGFLWGAILGPIGWIVGLIIKKKAPESEVVTTGKKVWQILVASVLISIGLILILYIGYQSGRPVSQPKPEVSVSELKKSAIHLVFRDAVFEKVDAGTVVKFSGTVIWVHDDQMQVSEDDDIEKGVYVYYSSAPELLAGDSVKIYGTYDGVEEFVGIKYVKIKLIDYVHLSK